MIDRIQAAFPGLDSKNTHITSPEDRAYNCIAWAAGDSRRFWWPGVDGYWPDGVLQDETIEAFTAAYEALGYFTCPDGTFEQGCEKVAMFVDADGTPTHAARQVSSGRWTSKLGVSVDIEHPLEAMEGGHYGDVVRFLRRRSRVESS